VRSPSARISSRQNLFAANFGNANVDELTRVAELTGGKAFDALGGDLTGAFQEIRGYQ
jgi:Ca-activated chloride channel family protein